MKNVFLLALISLLFVSCSSSSKEGLKPFKTFMSEKEEYLSQYIKNDIPTISVVRAKNTKCNLLELKNSKFINLKKDETYKIDEKVSVYVENINIDHIKCKISLIVKASENAYKKVFAGAKLYNFIETENIMSTERFFTEKKLEIPKFQISAQKYRMVLKEKYKHLSFLEKKKDFFYVLRIIKDYSNNTSYESDILSESDIIYNTSLSASQKVFTKKIFDEVHGF